MNVLMVGAEADPFAKVGGLADVAGSLPGALRQLGIDVRVLMPDYGFLDRQRYQIQPLFAFGLPFRNTHVHVEVSTTTHNSVPFYFLRALPYFGHEWSVYSNWEGDVPRFTVFSVAALAVAYELRFRIGWFPDIFHVNDWHTGLIPFLIDDRRSDVIWRSVGSIVTIHNMQYQGEHVGGWLWEYGIPGRHHPELVARGLTDNMLAIALAYADSITTVSPRYAIEIQSPNMGYGLDGLVRARLDDVCGILNGIDMEKWNPATDKLLPHTYSLDDFVEKRPLNKIALQHEVGLPERSDVPVIGLVSRLVWQKGIDLALEALRPLLAESDVQFIGLGSGEEHLNHMLWRLGEDFRWKASAHIGYNALIAQHVYAGADIVLVPSRFEPCGLTQMIAMRYGALPLVRETGGLADTVQNYDNLDGDVGTGFVFLWEEPSAIFNTMRWAVETYRRKPFVWRRMQQRAMQTDFGWGKSARQYAELYEQIVTKRKGHAG